MTPSVMFHHFCDERHPRGQGAISAQELVELINHVGRRHILPADEWMRRAVDGGLGEQDVCLTFDDGLRCQFDVAFPVLQDMGLTAFWFVYSSVFEGNIEPIEVYRYFRTVLFSSADEFHDCFSDAVAMAYPDAFRVAMAGFDADNYLAAFPFYTTGDRIFRYLRDDVLGVARYNSVMAAMMVERGFDGTAVAELLWMNDTHLRTLREAGHLIGLHSYTHPTRLVELDASAQADEYRKNFDHLTGVLGEAPLTMSHPCNSYAAATLPILTRLGIKLGFRSNMEAIPNPSRFEFPRQDHAILMKEMRA